MSHPNQDTLTTSSPRRPPAATLPAVVIAVVLIAVAVVGVHDLVSFLGGTSSGPWVQSVSGDLDGLTARWWTSAIAVVAIVLGLVLLRTSLRPSRRTHQATPMEDGDVWISKRAVKRLAEHAAARTAGVETAEARVRRRKIKMRTTTATTGAPQAELLVAIEDNVRAALDGFSDLRVIVRTKEAKDVA